MTLSAFIILPIFVGVVIYAIPKAPIRFLVCITELILACLVFYLHFDIQKNGPMYNVLGSDVSYVGIVLIADSLKVLLLAITVLLFFACFIYTMREEFFDKKFVMLFFILQGLLSGVFLSDDLFNLYVLLEVATVVVAILIMFKRDICAVYDGMVYLLSQVVCMIFYLFGVGYLYKIFGVLSIEQISAMIDSVDSSSLIVPFAFIMTSVCLKSAFFPLFSWLPRAHGTPSAPSAVSAILSGLYVKNGIYLFLIFARLFAPAINFSPFFIVISTITAVLGFLLAIVQTDIKLILAYHTVSQTGLIALGLSIQNQVSNAGAIYHIVCHALFKSLLFLAAGMIIKQYQTRDIRQIHGVFKSNKVAGIATILGVLGITGAPFFNGSVSKYFINYGVKDTPLEYVMIFINFGTILSFVKYSKMLWGKQQNCRKEDTCKKVVVLSLGALCFLGGIFGVPIINTYMDSSIQIDVILYAEKCIIYFVSLILAILTYKHVIAKKPAIYKLNKYVLNFQQIIVAMVMFFISVSLYSYLV